LKWGRIRKKLVLAKRLMRIMKKKMKKMMKMMKMRMKI